MSLSNKKQSKILPKIIKNNQDITYEIEGNENANTKELSTIETNSKKLTAKSIPFPEDFSVKMILGSPAKIRATAARIIKAGARGDIPQVHVNSLIWQLRSLIYFDQVNADLSYMDRLERLEKEIKRADKL